VDDPVARLALYDSVQADLCELRLAALIHPLGLELPEGLPADRMDVVVDLGTGSGTLLPAIAARAPQAPVVGSTEPRAWSLGRCLVRPGGG
jgi:methylase of polypeptide subunit release factors